MPNWPGNICDSRAVSWKTDNALRIYYTPGILWTHNRNMWAVSIQKVFSVLSLFQMKYSL